LALFAALPALAQTSGGVVTPGAVVTPGMQLEFPRDEGSHPEYRIEWWYVTGWLDGADQADSSTAEASPPRGFQVTFFRVRTGLGEDNPSAFAPRQVLFAHAALADPRHGRLHHAQRAAREGFGLAYAKQGELQVRLDDWSLRQVAPNQYRAVVHGEDFDFDLLLEATQPPLLQGEDGYSRKGPDPRAASYYYSLPQLAVSGEIVLDGRRERVSGHAWFDHEWSSDYVDQDALGWDWMGINLHDGGALMSFRMRDKQGGERWAAATLRQPSLSLDSLSRLAGEGRGEGSVSLSRLAGEGGGEGSVSLSRLAGEGRGEGSGSTQAFGTTDVEWTPLATWRSPRTGVEYPVRWRVQVGNRLYRVEPLMNDAELDSRATTGVLYWEGAVRLLDDATNEELGRGYLELTGYGGKVDI
jgi:predicted secreted hydrolase